MNEDRRELGVAVVEPFYTDAASFTESGLFPIEMIDGQPTRWTGTRASMAVRLGAERAVLALRLRATHADLRRKPVQVTAFWNATPLSSVTLREPQWHDLRLPIADPARRGIVTLQVSRVWQPKASGVGEDRRYLGVQIQGLRVE
jgi:hypothetical protein